MAPSMIFMIVFDALILLGAVILFLRPSFTLKLLTWILRHTLVRLRVEGLENVPKEGPVLLCPNHSSNWDPILLICALGREANLQIMGKNQLFKIPRFLISCKMAFMLC